MSSGAVTGARVVVAALLVAVTAAVAGVQGAAAASPARTPDRPVRTDSEQAPKGGVGRSAAAATAASGVTYTQWDVADDQGDKYILIADQMNVCVFGDNAHSADIQVPIRIPNFGPVDASGHPAPGNALYGGRGRVELVLYDVDDKENWSPPEWDWAFFGEPIPGTGNMYDATLGQLAGANEAASTNFFSFDTEVLKPQSTLNPTGINNLSIDVDVGNYGTTTQQWCVAVNEVTLRVNTRPLPTVMIHGYKVDDGAMATLRSEWIRQYPDLAGLIETPPVEPFGGVSRRYPVVAQTVTEILDETKRSKVNLVGHSFGGLTARYYASRNPSKVANVALLGTPNGGSNLAYVGCGAWGGTWLGGLAGWGLREAIESQLGECKPGSALWELQPEIVHRFNDNEPDSGLAHYFALAGTDSTSIRDQLFGSIVGGTNDGLVSVESAFWRRCCASDRFDLGEPDQPGNHILVDWYNVSHAELHEDASPISDSLCAVYRETCPNGVPEWHPGRGNTNGMDGAAPASIGTPAAAFEPAPSNGELALSALESGAEGLELGATADRMVDPGASVDIPLAFEGAPDATILIAATNVADLTASYVGTPLQVGGFLDAMDVLGARLTSPPDGMLQITNTGVASVALRVVTNVRTTRRLDVAASPRLASPAEPVQLTVSLTETEPGDAPHLQIAGEGGTVLADLDPAPAGASTWQTTWTPPAGVATYAVRATVAGARPRVALGTFTVSSGAATVAAPFTEQLVDENGNGLADALVARPTVTAAVAGSYLLAGKLVATDGTVVASGSASVDLVAGTQTPVLRFQGRQIHAAGRAGPYRLADVTLARADEARHEEDEAADLGLTAAHALAAFERDRVVVRGPFSDRGRDDDADGVFDALLIDTHFEVETAGAYTIYGELVDANGAAVATRDLLVTLAAGDNLVTLDFLGSDVGRSGKAGPYRLSTLAATLQTDQQVNAESVDAYTTGPYAIGQFSTSQVTGTTSPGGPPVTLNLPTSDDYGRVSFHGLAGQVVFVQITSGTLTSAMAELRSPENRVLQYEWVFDTGAAFDTLPLPATGTYTVVVQPTGSAGGDVTVRVHAVPADATATATAGGAAVTVTTTVPGQKARVTFAGTANQRVSITASAPTVEWADLELVAPSGAIVGWGFLDVPDAGFIEPVVLPAAGTYTLRINPVGDDVGAISVRVYTVPADTTTTIKAGTPKTVTAGTPGQRSKLTFTGSANQKVTVKMTSTAISAGELDLLKPDGTVIAWAEVVPGGTTFVDTTVLAAAGTYTILVDPYRAQTGSATVTLTTITDVTGTITPGGAAVTKSTTVSGQSVRLTFSGTANSKISAKLTSTAITSGTLSLLAPSGTVLRSAPIGSGAFLDATLLPAGGTHTILVDPAGTATGSVTVTAYKPVDTSGTITPGGAAQTVTLATPGQNGSLTFTGSAGQRVSASLTASTLAAAAVTLAKPDGTTLASTTIGTSGGSIPLQTLPVVGTYKIVVDPTGANTGAVTVALAQGPADVTGPIVAGGAPVTVTIAAAEQNARLTFSGTAGQRVSLRATSSTISSATLSILAPSGATVTTATIGTSGGFLDAVALPATGTHTVLLDPSGANTGALTLTLYDVPADASGPIVPGGATVTATMAVPGQNGRLTFSGTAGRRISVQLTGVTIGSSSCCSSRISILRPDGSALLSPASFGTSGSFVDSLPLATTGTYAIVLDPQGADTGAATVKLNDLPDEPAGSIVAGGPAVTLTLGTPGENARLTFSGTAGQRVSLRASSVSVGTSSCCSLKLSILNPDGSTLVAPTYAGTFGGFLDTFPLPTSGTHTLVVDPQGADTGSLTLDLYDVPSESAGSITPGGASVPLTLGTPGQNARLAFSGTAGQRVSLRASSVTVGTSSCCSLKLSILNPDGSTLVAPTNVGTFGGFLDAVSLASTGTYTVVVDPQGADTGSLTLDLYDVPPDLTGPIVAGGAPVSVTLGTPGRNARLTFSGTAAQRVSLKASSVTVGTSSCCSLKLSILNPDGSTLVAPTFVGTFGGFLDAVSLASTGTYTVVVDPQGADTGSLTLTLHDVPADAALATSPGGAPVTMSLATPGQNGRATFTGTAAGRISLAVDNVTVGTSSCCSVRVSILNPDGTTLVSPTFVGTFGGFIDTRTLGASGTYTIFVDPQGADAGSLRLSLHDVPADLGGTVAVGGAGTTASITVPGQNARLTFSATASQALTLNLTGVTVGTSSCCSARVSILRPDGTTLVSPSFYGTSGKTLTFTPTTTGTHTLVLDPDAGATGNTTASLAVAGGAPTPDAVAVLVGGY